MELSMVIPMYNEEKQLISTLDKTIEFLNKYFKTFEIIAVNDGSTDHTIDILNNYNNSNLKIISFDKNMGKGYAVKCGMEKACGKYCFFTDADLPYSLTNILTAIETFHSKNADLVIGSRYLYKKKPDIPYPFYRKIMSRTFSFYINMILDLGIMDTQCGFKGFTHSAAKKIFPLLSMKRFSFDVELLYIAKKFNMNIQCIPVNLHHNSDSSVRILFDSIQMALNTAQIKLNDLKGMYRQN